ncbi:putative septation protein SpoVG [subsurface metagenome]
MQVTEVRVKLMGRKSERLKAFCSVTFDGEFVVRDVKVIEGTNGLFVAMPSRQLSDRCPMCRNKNALRARFCGECGARLDESRATRNEQGRLKLHVDIAHPLNSILDILRELLHSDIAAEYTAPRAGDIKHSLADISRAKELLGYKPRVNFEQGLRMAIDWYKANL